MVLAGDVKHAVFVIIGAVCMAALGFIAGALFTDWIGRGFARSQDDIDDAVTVVFATWVVLVAGGGYLGHLAYRRATARSRSA